ncbi:hypothetical protein VKT23_012051 [Stygiomarasmius scandens]|uniref:Uncharacterized protein n=1 Tax=Marasmiellus scandens TaxID=2682957 RepID=A0ABR1J6T9_9AGAR
MIVGVFLKKESLVVISVLKVLSLFKPEPPSKKRQLGECGRMDETREEKMDQDFDKGWLDPGVSSSTFMCSRREPNLSLFTSSLPLEAEKCAKEHRTLKYPMGFKWSLHHMFQQQQH